MRERRLRPLVAQPPGSKISVRGAPPTSRGNPRRRDRRLGARALARLGIHSFGDDSPPSLLRRLADSLLRHAPRSLPRPGRERHCIHRPDAEAAYDRDRVDALRETRDDAPRARECVLGGVGLDRTLRSIRRGAMARGRRFRRATVQRSSHAAWSTVPVSLSNTTRTLRPRRSALLQISMCLRPKKTKRRRSTTRTGSSQSQPRSSAIARARAMASSTVTAYRPCIHIL